MTFLFYILLHHHYIFYRKQLKVYQLHIHKSILVFLMIILCLLTAIINSFKYFLYLSCRKVFLNLTDILAASLSIVTTFLQLPMHWYDTIS
jgi:hypothetical protein